MLLKVLWCKFLLNLFWRRLWSYGTAAMCFWVSKSQVVTDPRQGQIWCISNCMNQQLHKCYIMRAFLQRHFVGLLNTGVRLHLSKYQVAPKLQVNTDLLQSTCKQRVRFTHWHKSPVSNIIIFLLINCFIFILLSRESNRSAVTSSLRSCRLPIHLSRMGWSR